LPPEKLRFIEGFRSMRITIRELQGRDGEYFAYVNYRSGKATHFVHFNDTVWGTFILHNFIQMLKGHFK
jgi:hypothetical protein